MWHIWYKHKNEWRQLTVPLSHADAREVLRICRKVEYDAPMGHRYKMVSE